MNPADVLPDDDFRFTMRFTRGSIADFFKPSSHSEQVLSERKQWLKSDSVTYLALDPEAVPLLEETMELAEEWKTLPNPFPAADASSELDRCRWLGENWEADFLLMKPDPQGIFRLRGGCLCFPSHWDLREKMGRPLSEIHGPVPGLNDTLGAQIDGFLRRIKPGISWERANWGLARTPDLNLHPSRKVPRLDSSVSLDEVWWRLEKQSLVTLPESGGILFGIRLVIKPLKEIRQNSEANRKMIRALETMPEDMAVYKGIARARQRLLELLAS